MSRVGTREEWLEARVTWQLLDRTSRGRGGDFEGWPRLHDEYPDA